MKVRSKGFQRFQRVKGAFLVVMVFFIVPLCPSFSNGAQRSEESRAENHPFVQNRFFAVAQNDGSSCAYNG